MVLVSNMKVNTEGGKEERRNGGKEGGGTVLIVGWLLCFSTTGHGFKPHPTI